MVRVDTEALYCFYIKKISDSEQKHLFNMHILHVLNFGLMTFKQFFI